MFLLQAPQNYYLVKEVSESAMIDSIDYGYYRESGELRINREKYVENFLRRFAENANLNTYQIDFYDIYESPPKASVEVTTKSNTYKITSDQTSFDIVNRVDSVLELNGQGDVTVPKGNAQTNNPPEISQPENNKPSSNNNSKDKTDNKEEDNSSKGNTENNSATENNSKDNSKEEDTPTKKVEDFVLENDDIVLGHFTQTVNQYNLVIKNKKGQVLDPSDFIFTSSKSPIASVNEKGLVEAHFMGDAKITVTSKYDKTKKAECNVKVIHTIYVRVDLTKDIIGTDAETGEQITLKKDEIKNVLLNGTGPVRNKNYFIGDMIKIGSRYYKIDPYETKAVKYYISDVYSNEVAEKFVNQMGFDSATNYLFWQSQGAQNTYMFKGSKGNWKVERSFVTNSGDAVGLVLKGDCKLTADGGPNNKCYGVGVHFNLNKVGEIDYQGSNIPVIWKRGIYDNHRSSPWHTWGNGKHEPASHSCTRFLESDIIWLASQIDKITGSRIIDF